MNLARTIKRLILFHTLLVSFVFSTQGQETVALKEVKKSKQSLSGQAIIYGSFIQRLSTNSIGFPQDIRLVNITTTEVFSFRVKPTLKSGKENTFCYFLKPGTYMILDYWWTDNKWYGGNAIIEPVYNGIDATDSLREKIDNNRISQRALKRFTFKIENGSINYVGTWHFDTGMAYFTNEKDILDEKLEKKYKWLDFVNAQITIPE